MELTALVYLNSFLLFSAFYHMYRQQLVKFLLFREDSGIFGGFRGGLALIRRFFDGRNVWQVNLFVVDLLFFFLFLLALVYVLILDEV